MPVRDLANCNDSAVSRIVCLGAAVKKQQLAESIPTGLLDFHKSCRLHIHDFEFYDSTYNCIGVNPSELMKDEEPQRFSAACNALFRGIIALTNQQSGGIGLIDFDRDMAQYVGDETDADLEEALYQLLLNLNTFVRKGSERAYVTLNFGLSVSREGRRVIKALLAAFSRRQFIFPNLVWKIKSGINRHEGDPNYDLFSLACQVTSQHMNPTYFNADTSFNQKADPHEIGIMGCRTRVADNRFGKMSARNRGNVAAVTINPVQMALEAEGDRRRFDGLLKETMDAARQILLHRFRTLAENGDFRHVRRYGLYLGAEKKKTEEMLKNGTFSIGFIGLWDALKMLHGVENWTPQSLRDYSPEALGMVAGMRRRVDSYGEETGLNFSLLASSAEGVSGRFPRYDGAHYRNAADVRTRGHYTNSFHIPVETQVTCFEKLELEGPFHSLCNGGHISYVELAESPFGNPEAIAQLVEFACNCDVGYFGINFPLDICRVCGRQGTFASRCVCGSSDIQRLRRVSGYLADVDTFTEGKNNELRLRRQHVFGKNLLNQSELPLK